MIQSLMHATTPSSPHIHTNTQIKKRRVVKHSVFALDGVKNQIKHSSSLLHLSTIQMDGRKWEDLAMDCLENVFGRVGIESLILDVPFVCKSWYKTTLSPRCWQKLFFPRICNSFESRLMKEYKAKRLLSITAIIKFIVSRSNGSVNVIELPGFGTEQALAYIADECPALKGLILHDHNLSEVPNFISKWKNLEYLGLVGSLWIKKILPQISIHCKNFNGLSVTRACIGEDKVMAIIALLPNLKYLNLRGVCIERKILVMILQGCKKLVHFDVRRCLGFEGDDQEIMKLASHIAIFKCEGSRAKDEGFEFDRGDAFDFGYHFSD